MIEIGPELAKLLVSLSVLLLIGFGIWRGTRR